MSQLKLCPLRSSSKGNATVVFDKETKILVDCGISAKALEDCLARAGIGLGDFDALIITHEHSDHIKGAGVISRKYSLPIYANALTWRGMREQIGKIDEENIHTFVTGEDFFIKDIKIKSFHTYHDAAEPVAYVFEKEGVRLAVATDTGWVSNEMLDVLSGCYAVLLEANYDLRMLEAGPYPYELKQRIKGRFGHLDNEMAGEIARELVKSGTKEIILGHLSEENNYPWIAYETVRECIDDDTRLLVVLKDGLVVDYSKAK